jgi:hypothetical protein
MVLISPSPAVSHSYAFHRLSDLQKAGNNGQYDPTLTDVPQPEQGHARDDWKPIQGTPFVEGSRSGGNGIHRVLEMMCAAVK